MTGRTKDDDERATGVLGAYAIGGPGLAGAVLVGSLLGEKPRDNELGPTPIGSDPWLVREVKTALANDGTLGADGTLGKLVVTAKDAVVTIVGAGARRAEVEAAAHTVQGIKSLRIDP